MAQVARSKAAVPRASLRPRTRRELQSSAHFAPTQRLARGPKMAVIVADAIADDIFKRRLKPGVLIATEGQMIEQYGVARGTVREALRLLEAEGLIRIRSGPNGGAVVEYPSGDRLARLLSILLSVSGTSFQEVVEARNVVEPTLAALAAIGATDEEIELLENSLGQLGRTIQTTQNDEFMEAGLDFHSLIATASRNRALSAFWFAIRRISDGHQVGVDYDTDARKAMLRAHQQIVDAIRTKDADRASKVMTKHMQGHIQYLTKFYPQVLRRQVSLLDNQQKRQTQFGE